MKISLFILLFGMMSQGLMAESTLHRHSHVHGKDCGHDMILHEGHFDYIHEGHMHSAVAKDSHAYLEHRLDVNEENPLSDSIVDCPPFHTLESNINFVPHADHLDVAYNNQLFNVSEEGCQFHGSVSIIAN